MKGRRKREMPEKIRRPAASSGTIPTCENPGVARPGIEPGSPWREASRLTAQPPWLRVQTRRHTPDINQGGTLRGRDMEGVRGERGVAGGEEEVVWEKAKMRILAGQGQGRPPPPPLAAAIVPCLPLCKWLSSLYWPPTWVPAFRLLTAPAAAICANGSRRCTGRQNGRQPPAVMSLDSTTSKMMDRIDRVGSSVPKWLQTFSKMVIVGILNTNKAGHHCLPPPAILQMAIASALATNIVTSHQQPFC
ncbi:hypothetical protein PR048_022670 [Dryococelus australis]|uniref:Uncharacterized protein n=1 Tax=Dryococelus australis TaxID=614101 RepID=A0ABQ9H1Q8_9NEOP|nr:hypothetical protein PR048_022670 [Dryococelus australis]